MSDIAQTSSPKGQRRNQRHPREMSGTQSKRKSFPHHSHNPDRFIHSQQIDHDYTARDQILVSDTPNLTLSGSDRHNIVSDTEIMRESATAAANSETTSKAGKTQKHRAKGQRTSSSPIIRPESGSKRPTSQSFQSTSNQTAATPVKAAYAGPTFHASPAPSALPLPTFFSKSVPEANGDRNLRCLGDADETSEKPGISSLKENAQTVDQQPPREESPLDIFFKADRHEKAERRKSSAPFMPNGHLSPSPLRTPVDLTSSPSSRGRHHSRHPTDDSNGAMFSFEMDGAAASHKPIGSAFATPYKIRMEEMRASSAPSHVMAQLDRDEEQRQAKTKALKMLLLAPDTQRPATASAELDAPHRSDSSPGFFSASSSTPMGTSSRYGSGVANSGPSFGPGPSHAHTHHHASLPLLRQAPLTAAANGSPRGRPPSSALRRELAPTTPTKASNPPLNSSPSAPSYQHGSDRVTVTPGNPAGYRDGIDALPTFAPSPSRPSQSRGASDPPSGRDVPDVKSMEDDLRRILKLDMLGAAGVQGSGKGVVGS